MPAEDEARLGVERLLFLRSLSAARPGGVEALQLAAAMRDVYFKRGQRLFAAGEPSGDIFFVVAGAVRMEASGVEPWEFEAPAVVGALDSFAGGRRTRTGLATRETHALVLAHTDWLAVLEEHFDFARDSVVRRSAALLRMHLGIPEDGGYRAVEAPGSPPATRLGLVERTLALQELPALQAAGVQATLRLAELCEELELEPEQVLFREGEEAEAIDLVAGGVIAIAGGAPPLRAAFGRGSLVGGAAAIGAPRQAFTARAAGRAVVLRVRKDDLFDVMEDHFELTRALLGEINAEQGELMARHGVRGER